ncbi:threonylcarbamoyl-AMP synthase [Candidatus Uhrbacteria bacterium CG10_big_fil_rev_8_21_14_0_10_48_16]|uniref:L-threonylcarbamoyladenylate synthase n=1 Tax=Candidatus Uhrbacteria bacterium CG10_big_fil_rev_8_21_14_0_10_48_16 TaxID=1975038 RepID=A0A2M8LHF6_9BACT|nr:MAG: threonylcarbamoyl-AMP synthase [Candidatus Uhrbacteria bacterium CG10_big_fil_rev_8_21_14_0_10_48_16]
MVSEEQSHQLEQAITILKEGGVVVFPTETAYGLAADAMNPKAVARVTQLKGRSQEKTFPLIASDREMVERIAGIPRGLMRLADTYWPGPLTLVLPVLYRGFAPGIVRDGTIAVRVSSHPIAMALSSGIGGPIVSTSANVSGEPVCYSVASVQKQFSHQDIQPDGYVDGGALDPEIPSTIVSVDDYGYPEVLRQGSIEIDV